MRQAIMISPGVAQDLFIVDEDRVVALPGNMTFEQGTMVEPTAVGAHATNHTDLKGKNVVVSGAGTIGNLVAQFVKARGARKVLITDISDYRLDIAEQCGIEAVLNVRNDSFEEGVDSFFGSEGFQAGFEAAGVKASLDVLMKYVDKGGDVIVLGEHELKVFGSMMYRHEDYETAADMIASGKILTDPLVTRKFPFEKYPETYKFIGKEGDRTMKVLIEM